MNVRKIKAACVSISALAMTACACTSDGLELKLEEGKVPAVATLSWQSSDDVSGTMTTTLADGRLFEGTYFKERSGKVLTSLGTQSGDRMNCQLRLARPEIGMSGGGEGECQLSDGTTVDAAFPAVRPIKRQGATAVTDRPV